MMRALAFLLAAVLAGCGGGSSGGTADVPHVPPGGLPSWVYGYFGCCGDDNRQIEQTAAHVSFVHVADWGNWDDPGDRERIAQTQIAQMQEARARGVTSFIVSTGFLTFAADYRYRGTDELVAYRKRLEALDLARDVLALYPIDEPDIVGGGIPADVMVQAYTATRAAWPGPKIAVIYGDHGTPGIAAADWIGHDAYGLGAGVLDRLPPIRADQRYILVPGGADPYRNDPSPFVTRANGDGRVAVLMPFLWVDYTDPNGVRQRGIGSNGMADTYRAIGCKSTGRCAPSG